MTLVFDIPSRPVHDLRGGARPGRLGRSTVRFGGWQGRASIAARRLMQPGRG